MPVMNVVILSAIVFAFAVFGTVLAWADFYSSRTRKFDQDKSGASAEQSPFKKAA